MRTDTTNRSVRSLTRRLEFLERRIEEKKAQGYSAPSFDVAEADALREAIGALKFRALEEKPWRYLRELSEAAEDAFETGDVDVLENVTARVRMLLKESGA